MKIEIGIDLGGDWRAAIGKLGIGLLAGGLKALVSRPDPPTSKPMKIEKKFRVLAQELANSNLPKGRRRLVVDGIIGTHSRRLFALIAGPDFAHLVDRPGNVAAERLTAALYQKISGGAIVLDGWWGPLTEAVAEKLWAAAADEDLPIRPDEDPAGKDQKKAGKKQVRCWRPSDRQMIAHYGQPGSGLVTFDVPYPLVLSWDPSTTVHRITMHRLVRPRALMALELISQRYNGLERAELRIDRYAGGANVRKKRGGTTWSAHAFGAAWDWDDARNRLRMTRRSAAFAQDVYRPFRDAMRAAGFMSLGECFDFDWMHWQVNPGPPLDLSPKAKKTAKKGGKTKTGRKR